MGRTTPPLRASQGSDELTWNLMRRPNMTDPSSKATSAVRASIESDTQFGAVVPPLHLSSNYTFAGFGEPRQYDYTRS